MKITPNAGIRYLEFEKRYREHVKSRSHELAQLRGFRRILLALKIRGEAWKKAGEELKSNRNFE